MAENTEVASFRVPEGTLSRLRMLAHRRSLEQGRDVTWSELVREVVEKNLLDQESGTLEPTPRLAWTE
jgi:predicted DNA-binding protein